MTKKNLPRETAVSKVDTVKKGYTGESIRPDVLALLQQIEGGPAQRPSDQQGGSEDSSPSSGLADKEA